MTVESVLITGGTGLIGSHLAGQLAANGYEVTVLGKSSRFAVPDAVPTEAAGRIKVIAGDVCDAETLQSLVDQSDIIFHKAASVGMAGAVESAREYVGENLAGTANLVDVLRSSKKPIKRVILGSSISVYGEGNYTCKKCGIVRPPLRASHSAAETWNPLCPKCGGNIEAAPTPETAERNGDSIYAVTRKAQEDLLIGACRQAGIPISVLRYSTVLGPGQSWHNPFTRVLELAATGESPLVREDGLQTRDFIFIEDLVQANLLLLKNERPPVDVLNVSAIHMPLGEFVELMLRLMGRALERDEVRPSRGGFVPGDVRHCWVDCSKLQTELGFSPARKADEGVRALVEWFVHFKGLTVKRPSAAG